MKVLKAFTQKVSLAIFLSATFVSPFAFATDVSETEARMEALSYAPQGSNLDERFSQFEFEESEYAEHELNDSWLGMPAYSSDGERIGYIKDAYLDEYGYVTEIIVGLHESQDIVEIKGKYAELTDDKVQFELSTTQIASLANQNELASLTE
jgi:sporulation protein YlmC with PRC-barrel domain